MINCFMFLLVTEW